MLMSIRKHLPVSKSLAQLAQEGRFAKVRHRKQSEQPLEPFEEELLALLEKGDVEGFLTLAVKTKRNIAVAGPTGSGKTYAYPLVDGRCLRLSVCC
jgi:type IV secretion system protein VirB11